MKKIIFLIGMWLTFLSIMIASPLGLTVNGPVINDLPDIYKYNYLVYVRRDNRIWDVHKSTHNLYTNSAYNWGDNQQFLVMPVTYGDRYFYLVPVFKGGVLDIHSGGNIYMYDNYPHGGNNQIFYLSGQTTDSSNNTYYVISSLSGVGAFDMSVSSLDRDPFDHPVSCGGNIYYNGTVHYGDNQQFRFVKNNPIKYTVPRPQTGTREFMIEPPHITQYGVQPPYDTSSSAELIGRGIIPFIYIKDPMYDRSVQVKESPYYILTRKQYWRNIWWYDKPASAAINYSIQTAVGVVASSSTTFEQMTSTTFTVNSEIGISSDGISSKLGNTISQQIQNKIVVSNSITVSKTDTETTTINLPAGQRISYAIYQLVDSYTLQRLDGTQVTSWTIEPKGHKIAVYYDGTLNYENEPNNNYTQANGPMLSGVRVSGVTESSGCDWYYFDLPTAKSIGVHFEAPYRTASFYHESNTSTPVASFSQNYDGSAGKDYVFTPTKTGRYYVEISGYTGKYSIIVFY